MENLNGHQKKKVWVQMEDFDCGVVVYERIYDARKTRYEAYTTRIQVYFYYTVFCLLSVYIIKFGNCNYINALLIFFTGSIVIFGAY